MLIKINKFYTNLYKNLKNCNSFSMINNFYEFNKNLMNDNLKLIFINQLFQISIKDKINNNILQNKLIFEELNIDLNKNSLYFLKYKIINNPDNINSLDFNFKDINFKELCHFYFEIYDNNFEFSNKIELIIEEKIKNNIYNLNDIYDNLEYFFEFNNYSIFKYLMKIDNNELLNLNNDILISIFIFIIKNDTYYYNNLVFLTGKLNFITKNISISDASLNMLIKLNYYNLKFPFKILINFKQKCFENWFNKIKENNNVIPEKYKIKFNLIIKNCSLNLKNYKEELNNMGLNTVKYKDSDDLKYKLLFNNNLYDKIDILKIKNLIKEIKVKNNNSKYLFSLIFKKIYYSNNTFIDYKYLIEYIFYNFLNDYNEIDQEKIIYLYLLYNPNNNIKNTYIKYKNLLYFNNLNKINSSKIFKKLWYNFLNNNDIDLNYYINNLTANELVKSYIMLENHEIIFYKIIDQLKNLNIDDFFIFLYRLTFKPIKHMLIDNHIEYLIKNFYIKPSYLQIIKKYQNNNYQPPTLIDITQYEDSDIKIYLKVLNDKKYKVSIEFDNFLNKNILKLNKIKIIVIKEEYKDIFGNIHPTYLKLWQPTREILINNYKYIEEFDQFNTNIIILKEIKIN